MFKKVGIITDLFLFKILQIACLKKISKLNYLIYFRIIYGNSLIKAEMTIQFLKRDRYHIDFTCDDDVASNELLIGIKKILHEYLSEFYAEINNEVWDYFAVEFWYDSGQLIIIPEKGIN